MGASIPKQFINVAGAPVLVHTLRRFYSYDAHMQLIVVLHADYLSLWQELSKSHNLPRHLVVTGGSERFDSVANGLNHVADDTIVAVHDAVRPFVSISTIDGCFNKAHETGAAIPVVPVSDSLRMLSGDTGSEAVDRAKFRAVQTPQCFKASLLKAAYRQDYQPSFTDDASVVESFGHSIALVNGNAENMKLTTPNDLNWAEFLLKKSLKS